MSKLFSFRFPQASPTLLSAPPPPPPPLLLPTASRNIFRSWCFKRKSSNPKIKFENKITRFYSQGSGENGGSGRNGDEKNNMKNISSLSVMVIPQSSNGTIFLLNRNRFSTVRDSLIELPSEQVLPGEELEQAAKRCLSNLGSHNSSKQNK